VKIMKRNIKIVVEYDGTNYSGWQIQKNTPYTIQQVLEEALSELNKSRVDITGAGRTDAGVHAAGQTANFFLDVSIPVEKIPLAVNTCLPSDIVCIKAEEVPDDFHARYNASGKKYRYRILNSDFNSVFIRNYVYKVHKKLDIELMQNAAEILEGCHDFAAFMASGGAVDSTVRNIYSLNVYPARSDQIWIDVIGDGFLYNMVRIIAGTLIEIGKEKRSLKNVKKALKKRKRKYAGFTAPAKGLTLIEVFYD